MNIKHFFGVVKRRWLVVACVVAVGLALMVVFRDAVPSTFVGVSHVDLVSDGTRDPSVGIVDLPSIATSTVVLERVRQQLHLPITLIDFKLQTSAAVLGRSSIMAISYRDLSADRAIAVSNALSDELSRYYDEISTSRYNVNVDRLSNELEDQAVKVRAIEEKLGKVVAQNPFVASDAGVNTLTTQLGTLLAARAEGYAQLLGDQAIATSLAPNEESTKLAHHEILTADPTYNAARTAAATDTAMLSVDQAGYTKEFPGLAGAKAKVQSELAFADAVAAKVLADKNSVSPTEAANASNLAHQNAVVAGDQERVSQLDSLVADEQSKLADYPNSSKNYDQLRAERDALQSEYTALANRRANALANRAEASSLGSVVVLDRAIKADTQLTGSRARTAVIALIFVLALAFGAAFLVESLDPRIRRAAAIEELYGIPVVARFGAK